MEEDLIKFRAENSDLDEKEMAKQRARLEEDRKIKEYEDKTRKEVKWTEDEDKIIIDNFETFNSTEGIEVYEYLAQILPEANKDAKEVKRRCKQLKIATNGTKEALERSKQLHCNDLKRLKAMKLIAASRKFFLHKINATGKENISIEEVGNYIDFIE